MSKYALKLSLRTLVVVLISVKGFCQTTDTTSTQTSKKTTPKIVFKDDRLFNGVRVGVDVAGIAYSYMSKDDNFELSNKYEINGDFGIRRYFLTLDLGQGTFKRKVTDSFPSSSNYTSKGTYFRFGGDYRISKSAKSFLFIGTRFGKSFFKEEATIDLYRDATVGPAILVGHDNIDRKLSANWLEMTTGMKVYIWKNFYLGYTMHFKLLLKSKKIKEEEPLDIPGFGVANKPNNLGMSFHIMYRIPFGKDPVMPLQ
jgi:hypothetical protein